MSNKSFINVQAIMTGLKAESNTQVIKLLGDKLYELGYVNKDYVSAVIEREATFPTGLVLEGKYNVAIPHTDTKYVHNAGIAFTSLEKPVIFKNIEDQKSEVETNMVFLLAVKDPKEQVELLQKLVEIFQNEELIDKIYQTRNSEEVKDLLNKQLGIEEV